MNLQNRLSIRLLAIASAVFFSAGVTTANADEPCPPDGDFGECKVLIEINATDGDIGFHFLIDGDDLRYLAMYNPEKKKIFSYFTKRELRRQTLTETFAESAEPLCWDDPEADEDDDIVTLEEFLDRFMEGTYHFIGISEGWEISHGETELTFALPAAPSLEAEEGAGYELGFDGSVISWEPGDDLGECSLGLEDLVDDEVIPDPEGVEVAAWEVVLEPDLDPDPDGLGALVFSIRVPVGQLSVTVPQDYLDSLPADTPVKIEVGAIGVDDNATFTEEDGFCVNEDEGCEEED